MLHDEGFMIYDLPKPNPLNLAQIELHCTVLYCTLPVL